jgi:hypothetical protein
MKKQMKKQGISLLAVFFAFAVAGLVSQVCLAQDTAVLVGKVQDTSGAVVPGAKVEARHVATNRVFSAVTTDTGDYTITDVPPGAYTLSISHEGFKEFIRSGLEVELARSYRVDAHLELGEVKQTIQVTGAAPILHTETPENAQYIPQDQVLDLPTNASSGRDFTQFAYLVTGVMPLRGTINPNYGEMNTEGHRGSDNTTYFDGTEFEDMNGDNSAGIQPNLDALQGVEVKVGMFDAEYGKRPGAEIITQTKSGTNQFHGEGFDFLQNNHLNARNFFQPGPNTQYKRNDFGGMIGGPIYIPGLFNGKDKAWFFVSYDGARQRSLALLTGVVPTAAQLQGLFSDPITNPQTGLLFPTNSAGQYVIPSNLISPISAKLASFYPAPNTVSTYNYTSPTTSNPSNPNQLLARVDVSTSPNDRWYGRFFWDKNINLDLSPISTFDEADSIGNWSQMFNNTRTFGPNLVNEFLASFYRRDYFVGPAGSLNPSVAGIDQTLGIANFPTTPIDHYGMVDILITGYIQLGSVVYKGPVNEGNWQAKDTISFVKGAHSLKGGFEWQHQYANFNLPSRALMTFEPNFTGDAFASFLLGDPYSTQEGGVIEWLNTREDSEQSFFEDHWRATRKLTVDLGVRYEYYNAWKDKRGYSGNWSAATGQLSTPYENLTLQPWQTGRFQPNYPYLTYINHAVLPRAGLAYGLTDKTVVRAGYGMYSGQPVIGWLENLGGNPVPNFFANVYQSSLTTPTINIATAFTGTALSPGIPTYEGVQNPLPIATTQNYNLSVEHQLAEKMVVKLGYLGSNSVHGTSHDALNDGVPGAGSLQSRRPYPLLNYVDWVAANGQNNVQGLEASFERRPGREGLGFLASFTKLKSIDDYGARLGITADPNVESPNVSRKQDRGLGSGNLPGRFVLSGAYHPPFGPGKAYLTSGPAGQILGGWTLGEIFNWTAGPYDTIDIPFDEVGVGSNADQRPNQITNPNSGAPHTIAEWFNTSAFAMPAAYTYGNAGRGTVQGPHIVNLDFDLLRSFKLTERLQMQFRVDAFNILNHTNFSQPDNGFTDHTFGAIGSSLIPREIQLSLKVLF